MKLHPKLYFKKSQLFTDSTKDAGLCGFLISFESADMSPSSNKESKDNITEEWSTKLWKEGLNVMEIKKSYKNIIYKFIHVYTFYVTYFLYL